MLREYCRTQARIHTPTSTERSGMATTSSSKGRVVKWQTRFLDLALMIAGWSKDSTKVGAVLVDGNRIISLGFNGFARGVSDEATDRATKIHKTIHAESNAILFANRSVTGCTLYCTHPPCANCASLIIQSGITKVVFRSPTADFMSRWADSVALSLAMFDEASVEVTQA